MADEANANRHGEKKALHPFFTARRNTIPAPKPAIVTTEPDNDSGDGHSEEKTGDPGVEESTDAKPKRKRRKAQTEAREEEEQHDKKPRPRKKIKPSGGRSIVDHLVRLHSTSGESTDLEERSPRAASPEGSNHAEDRRAIVNEKSVTNGGAKKRQSTIVHLKYGDDVESRLRIGKQIAAILEDAIRQDRESHAPLETANGSKSGKEALPSPRKPAQATQPAPKKIHPLFLGKAKSSNMPAPKSPVPKSPAEKKEEGNKTSAAPPKVRQFTATPCSPKKVRSINAHLKLPQFGSKNPSPKNPGAKQPAWPWKDMMHVRGDAHGTPCSEDASDKFPSRKSKGHAVKVSPVESLVDHITAQLNVLNISGVLRNIDHDKFLPPPSELRLPTKHLESGSKLQKRVASELRSWMRPAGVAKQGRKNGVNPSRPPRVISPQLVRLYDSLQTSLSAFDKSQCEIVSWPQKYAPVAAVEVLQAGREAFLLKEWLQALMVQSVDKGNADSDKAIRHGSKSKPPSATKKAKKRKKLDDFIVSSDEEVDEMGELSDDAYDFTPSGRFGIVKKSVIRSFDPIAKAKEGMRLTNAVLISGPHGSGKTAAVYAVAKELGFEVFEINPSTRRSGKDVLEKIGDMTRNHLVQHHGSDSRPNDEVAATLEDNTAEEVKSGKQATMNSFFRPKSTPAKPNKKAVKTAPVVMNQVKKEPKNEAPKSQKQSLILLEEVDVLFEEDKQFWATVTGLIAQAKRPFIMTCNDETQLQLPWQSLSLHGIFRFTAPPTDLAVDRLLLIAANEGHALKRNTVEALYESRNCDLRAATMDLSYWCQIGVGDRRGGFDWFYPRWPKGVDLDENKEVVRVVSENTYLTGMNWLGRDSVVDEGTSPTVVEEELMKQVWDFWQLDLGHWQDSGELARWTSTHSQGETTPNDRRAALDAFGDFADAVSVADLCSSGSFAIRNEVSIDTTLPELSSKSRDDLVQGLQHLETSPIAHYYTTAKEIPTTLKLMARRSLYQLQRSGDSKQHDIYAPFDESNTISSILRSFTSISPSTPAISRIDLSLAFDSIAASDSLSCSASYLDPSVFDRTLHLITLDVAPYVRSIVAYEARLQNQRLKLSSLVSEGGQLGRPAKKMRTTRAALSALEGGLRTTTRRERWFKADLNPHLVMKTGSAAWQKAALAELGEEDASSATQSPSSSPKANRVEESPPKVRKRGRPKKVVVECDSADELG